jgi:hypothetical protein
VGGEAVGGSGSLQPWGILLRLDGDRWRLVDERFPDPILDLAGSRTNDLYAVSKNDAWHFDGTRWIRLPSTGTTGAPLSSDAYRALLIDPVGGVLTVGRYGTILRWRPAFL